MPLQFKVMPSITDLVNELAAEGHSIDLATAQALWDKATVNALAEHGVRQTTEATFKRLSPEMWGQLREPGVFDAGITSLSALLEEEDPTPPGSRDEMLGVDAFTRMCSLLTDANGSPIQIHSDLRNRRPAHSVADFRNAGPLVEGSSTLHVGAVLLQELFLRAHQEGVYMGTRRFHGTELFYASDSPLWPGLNPTYLTTPVGLQPRLRQPLLNDMVAIRSVVKSDTFKWPTIANQAAASRLRRVAEGADLPIVELTVSSDTGYVYKFGVAIKVTDEAARRTPIDWLRFHAARIGAQNALDREQVCFEAGVAAGTSTNTSTIGGTASTTAVLKTIEIDNMLGILEEAGFNPGLCLGTRAVTTRLKNADTGSANSPAFRGSNAALAGGGRPEELDHPPIYSRSYVTAYHLVYWDGTAAMGEATEAGSDKNETDRNIVNGTNILTISEVVGYHAIDASLGAVATLNTNA